jgi:hypothetical protein
MTRLRCSRALALLYLSAGCAGTTPAPASGAPALQPTAAIEVPQAPAKALLSRVRIASGLNNPRGMQFSADGALLVAEAGTGDPQNPNTGALLAMRDVSGDGDYDDRGERKTLLGGLRSVNILDVVRRDEVFGMGPIAQGGGETLAASAYFGGPSTVFRIDGEQVSTWGTTHTNLNDLAYDARRKVWVAVASTSDEVVQLAPGGGADRILKIPPLASGQDPVPAYLRFDPSSGDMLVTLFSGSPEGEEGGAGTEIVPRSASIVRVNAEARTATPLLGALTVPTDLEIDEDGSIYVLEFCNAFLDPVKQRADMQGAAMHGGFKRFSGRLLHVDRKTRTVSVVAEGLDAPTNLMRSGRNLYVAEGMGTPGRLIPGPDGQPVALTGFIERIALP